MMKTKTKKNLHPPNSVYRWYKRRRRRKEENPWWLKDEEKKWCDPNFQPGGVLELFFDGVCGPRSETPTHI